MLKIAKKYSVLLSDPDGDEVATLSPVYESEFDTVRDIALRSGYLMTVDLAPLHTPGAVTDGQ